MVTTLADHVEKILATRQRSNGRDFRERVDLEAKARAVVAIYRQVIAAR